MMLLKVLGLVLDGRAAGEVVRSECSECSIAKHSVAWRTVA